MRQIILVLLLLTFTILGHALYRSFHFETHRQYKENRPAAVPASLFTQEGVSLEHVIGE